MAKVALVACAQILRLKVIVVNILFATLRGGVASRVGGIVNSVKEAHFFPPLGDLANEVIRQPIPS
ncbi:hypothetical protein WLF14_01730 [Pseudomonas fluorescens]|uniref:hypothetical protein n=1 Tax=Pseudomonas fluorescens TaxID=294 RepID=UPI00313F0995